MERKPVSCVVTVSTNLTYPFGGKTGVMAPRYPCWKKHLKTNRVPPVRFPSRAHYCPAAPSARFMPAPCKTGRIGNRTTRGQFVFAGVGGAQPIVVHKNRVEESVSNV